MERFDYFNWFFLNCLKSEEEDFCKGEMREIIVCLSQIFPFALALLKKNLIDNA